MVELHPRLAADTRPLGETPEHWLRWMNDRRFPWLVLIPKVADAREWHDLPSAGQHDLLDLVNRSALHLQALTGAAKMNIGALGNVVPQLHVHVVARTPEDACWPGPVWGCGQALPYEHDEEPVWVKSLRQRLSYRCA